MEKRDDSNDDDNDNDNDETSESDDDIPSKNQVNAKIEPQSENYNVCILVI